MKDHFKGYEKALHFPYLYIIFYLTYAPYKA
jgi:hypothetical protein